jgi:hypothetical protein
MVLFAALVSIAFSSLTHRSIFERAKYAAFSFLAFLGAALTIGWLMYFFSR